MEMLKLKNDSVIQVITFMGKVPKLFYWFSQNSNLHIGDDSLVRELEVKCHNLITKQSNSLFSI